MNEDRLQILGMLQDNKISVEEAARLLEATEQDRQIVHPQSALRIPLPADQTVRVVRDVTDSPEAASEPPLAGAFLAGARLDGALLDGACLNGAFLLGADLRDADLRNADLSGAFLAFADLNGADLQGANLNGAFMPFANGANGNLAKGNFSGAFMPFTRFFRPQAKVV
jgi:hypothetical protein